MPPRRRSRASLGYMRLKPDSRDRLGLFLRGRAGRLSARGRRSLPEARAARAASRETRRRDIARGETVNELPRRNDARDTLADRIQAARAQKPSVMGNQRLFGRLNSRRQRGR